MQRARGIGIAILLVVGTSCLSACSSISNTSSSSIAQPAPLNGSIFGPDSNNDAALPTLPSDPAGQSHVITAYLKAHNLPLVGASMLAEPSGRQLTLYGYVGTDRGKTDAEDLARRLLNDPGATIVDRIVVQPELLAMRQSGNAGDPVAGISEYENAQPAAPSYPTSNEIKQYQAHQQGQSDWTAWIVPAIMIGLMFVP
jgi:hypothetical protein